MEVIWLSEKTVKSFVTIFIIEMMLKTIYTTTHVLTTQAENDIILELFIETKTIKYI